jgi:outer membrane protein assembly factor BamB
MKRLLFVVAVMTGILGLMSGFRGGLAGATGVSNWSQWRGSDGSGVSTETNLPVEWSPTSNITWKTPIPGRGHSSPIVWGNRIFLTTSIEGAVIPGASAVKHKISGQDFKHPDAVSGDRSVTLKVLCLDRDSGKILWEKTSYEGKVYDDHHRKANFASPTPATDGKNVYAYYGSEGIYCYDMSGRELWKANLGGMATLGMGTGTSPVLFQNLVILQCDIDEGEKSFLVALDSSSGKEVWRTPRKVQVSWSTPLLVTEPRAELIATGNENIISYDPRTGKELWRATGLESNAIPSPVAGRGMVFVSAGYPAKHTYGIKLGGSGDVSKTQTVVWSYEKGSAYVPSPILYGDYFYLTTDRGVLTCIEAKSGTVKYEGGRIPVPATFTASPVAFEGKILLTSEDGDTYLIKAGPVHEILRTNSVGEPVYASPAISDGRIFIRGEKNLFCIGKG